MTIMAGIEFDSSQNFTEGKQPPLLKIVPTNSPFIWPRGLIIAAVSVCAFLILLGITGNFVTIAALAKCRKLRSSTTVLVINLSAADLFFCSCVMPVRAFMFTNMQNEISCRIFLFFFYGNATVSLMTMVAISINRYLLVLHNTIYRKVFTKKGTCVVLLIVWIYSFLIWGIPTISDWGHFEVNKGTPFCRMSEEESSPKIFFGLFGFVLPCLAITSGYIAIFFAVWKSSIRVASHQCNVESSQLVFTRVLLIAYLSFMAFFLPNFIILMIPETRENPIALTIGEMLLWISSCTNPIVYVVCSRHYRQAYKSILSVGKTGFGDTSGIRQEDTNANVKQLSRVVRDFSENFSNTVPSSSSN